MNKEEIQCQQNILKVYENVESNLNKNEKLNKITYYKTMQIFPKFQNVQWEQDLILIEKEKSIPKKESIKRKALIIKTEDTTSDSFSLSERFIETFFTAETSRPKLINIIK